MPHGVHPEVGTRYAPVANSLASIDQTGCAGCAAMLDPRVWKQFIFLTGPLARGIRRMFGVFLVNLL